MIPKIIHYVWLGGNDLPPLEKKCIATWKKFNPCYDIIRWDETNLDIKDPVFIKAYKKKQWAYCSDYARFSIIKEYGGIYLDTDIELIKSLDSFLNDSCFLGKENPTDFNAAIFGAVSNHPLICDIFNEVKSSLKNDFVPIPRILNYVLNQRKYANVTIYPEEYFYPYNPFYKDIKLLLHDDIKEHTYAIHHWNYSWKPTYFTRIIRMLKRIMSKSKYFNYKNKLKGDSGA